MYLCVSRWREEEGSLTTVGSLNPARFSLLPPFSFCLSRSLILYICLAPAYSPFHSVSSSAVLSLSFSFRLFIYLAFGILPSFVPRARSSPGLPETEERHLHFTRENTVYGPSQSSSRSRQLVRITGAFLVFLIGPTYLSTNFAPHKK